MLTAMLKNTVPGYSVTRPDPPFGENKRKSFVVFFAMFVFSVSMLVARSPDAIFHPHFWAEDGRIFFQDAYNEGVHSLVMPNAGYFHLIPRVIAYFSHLFIPNAYVPHAYLVCSLFAFILVLFYIWTRLAVDMHTRVLMSLALTLIPIKSETVLNLANLQWYTALLPIIILLSAPNKNKLWQDGLVILIVGLTGPFSLLILPALVLIVFNNFSVFKGQRINPILPGILTATAIVQLASILTTPSRLTEDSGMLNLIRQLPYLIYIHLLNLIGLMRLYTPTVNYPILITLLLGVAAGAYAAFQQYKKSGNISALILIAISFTFIGANLYGFEAIQLYYRPTIVGRYFLLPSVLLIWSMIIYVYNQKTRYSLFYIVYAWYLTLFITRIDIFAMDRSDVHDKNWKAEAKKIDNLKQGRLLIPINPDGWYITLYKH